MRFIPIKTPIIRKGDDLPGLIGEGAELEERDIIVISSKAVATAEGRWIDLSKIIPSDEAKRWEKKLKRGVASGVPTSFEAAFRQAVMDETKRLHGTILPSCPHAMLTEIRPEGLSGGSLLVPNAGLDRSNVEDGYAVGWPLDPVASVRTLKSTLEKISGKHLALIITDSCCRPRRIGVTAFALVVSGFDPLESLIGSPDLFGHGLRMTQEARADQLATAANVLMGNAAQSIPAVIIRDHGLPMTTFQGWVPGIEKEEDLFSKAL